MTSSQRNVLGPKMMTTLKYPCHKYSRRISPALVLCAIGVLALHVRAQANLPQFEVASIHLSKSASELVILRPTLDGIRATNCTLLNLAAFAYGPTEPQLGDHGFAGVPKWADSDHYDLVAKVSDADAGSLRKLNPDQREHVLSLMLRGLLTERFQLAVHKESRDLPSFVLVIAKSGPKLRKAQTDDATLPNGALRMTTSSITGTSVSMTRLAWALEAPLKHPVTDGTGLQGRYDFLLEWQPDDDRAPENASAGGNQPATPYPQESSGPSIFTALQEQLGLRLESKKGNADIIVIDRVERPSEN
jgi:uncharacterized protein (TIGR03435 family)